MFSTLFEYTGKIVGELTHQSGKLAEATWEGTKSVANDIADAPSAFMKGYDEELFEAKPTEAEPNESTESESTEAKPAEPTSNIVKVVQSEQV